MIKLLEGMLAFENFLFVVFLFFIRGVFYNMSGKIHCLSIIKFFLMELFFELLISIVYRTVPILSLNWGYYAKSLNVLYSLTELGCVNIYMRYRYTVNNSFSRNC